MSRCEMLESTKKLAKRRKLDLSLIKCQFQAVCDGQSCPLLEDLSGVHVPDMGQIDLFLAKLERRQALLTNQH